MGSLGFLWLTSDQQLARLLDGTDDLERVCYQAYQDGGDRLLELGKTWGALHHLLTGTEFGGSPPCNFVLDGGRPIHRDAGASDIRFVRAFASDLLPQIATALDRSNPSDIERNWRQRPVHPRWWPESSDVIPPFLMEQLADVRNHVRAGVDRRLGMLAWLE